MQSPLLHNNWFGKAVGATCAWIWASSDPSAIAVAVISGIAIGHLYDTWASQHTDQDQDNLSRIAQGHAHKNAPHLEFLFAALGRLAKTSGRVAPEQIAYAQQLMRQMSLDAPTQAQAKTWFSNGKSDHFPLQQLSRECLQPSSQGTASRLTILRCMSTMACIDTRDTTLACLKQLGGYLGFAPARIAKEFGDIRAAIEHQKQGHKTNNAGASSITKTPKPDHALAAACKRLGLPVGANATKAKQAYRKLISRYHPDKLPRNASDEDKRAAAVHMVELRDALELIQAQRP